WNETRHGWDLINVNEMRWAGQPGQQNLQLDAAGGQGDDFFATSLSPQVILAKRRSFYARLLSMVDLQELLHNPNVNRADILKIMHSRLSLLVMNVLILAMGLPFFLSTNPG